MITEQQEKALSIMECNTHDFWSKETAEGITKPFGCKPKLREYIADGGPRNPKGLVLNNGAEAAVGISVYDLSGQIADFVGARPEGKMGRGFQVRANCQAIREKLK